MCDRAVVWTRNRNLFESYKSEYKFDALPIALPGPTDPWQCRQIYVQIIVLIV